ncbi:MAG: ABC transporter permease [Chloroflexi bacterium]|nr:ABC transporter permease [Chloroflexota bacterium]
MQAYIIRRLILIIPTLLLVTLIVFFTARFIPGSVIDQMIATMGAESSVADIELTTKVMQEKLGLDIPIWLQYGRWLGVAPYPDKGPTYPAAGFNGVLEGNLGQSLWTGRYIIEELRNRFPISLELGLIGIFSAVLYSIPIGIYSGIRQDTPGDYIGRTIAILAISVPSFWLGTMVVVYPSIWWNWMPPIEYAPIFKNFSANVVQFIIPGVILGLVAGGAEMRIMRTMMLEVLRQDYIRTAWSKGLSERVVVMRHALKNALIPVVTMIGLRVPILISGSIVMETIFNLPGIGRLEIEAITKRDYPIISGVNLIVASFVLIVNLIVDLTYAWLDPRVKYK